MRCKIRFSIWTSHEPGTTVRHSRCAHLPKPMRSASRTRTTARCRLKNKRRSTHKQAMPAVEGWGGDAMTVYERAGLLCTAMVFRGDSTRDADEMHAALKEVVTSLADHAPQLGRQASDVTLTLCDPGPSASVPQIDAASIFAAPTTRSLLLGIALEDPRVSPRQADCAVDKTLDGLDEAHTLHLLGA